MRLPAAFLALALIASPALAAEPPARPVADSGFSGRAAKAHLAAPQAAGFAKQIETELATKGARVAIVFRAGRPRDQLPKGISYTHGAFWVYGDIKGGDGQVYQGYSVYNLYQGDGSNLPVDESYLHQDYPFDFVSGAQTDDVSVIIPSPEMQRRILAVITSPAYEKLHVKSYTIVSNPLNLAHQNCTEFVLDVVAAAAWQSDDPVQITADLNANFKPTVVHANLLQRLFAPMASPAYNLDDQAGELLTATNDSIAAFMRDNGLLKDAYVINRGN